MSWGVWKAARIPLAWQWKLVKKKKKKSLTNSLWATVLCDTAVSVNSVNTNEMAQKWSSLAAVGTHNNPSVFVSSVPFDSDAPFPLFSRQNKVFARSSIQTMLSDDKADSRRRVNSLFESAPLMKGISPF